MTSSENSQPDEDQILACTVCRDVQNFDLLIEDMETALGDKWGDLTLTEAVAFFGQEEAKGIEFAALAIDDSDEDDLPLRDPDCRGCEPSRLASVAATGRR